LRFYLRDKSAAAQIKPRPPATEFSSLLPHKFLPAMQSMVQAPGWVGGTVRLVLLGMLMVTSMVIMHSQ